MGYTQEFRRVLAAVSCHAGRALIGRAEQIVAVAPTPSGRIAVEWQDLIAIGCSAVAKAIGKDDSEINDCICLEISGFVASREGKGPTFRPNQFQRNSPVSGAGLRLMGGQAVDHGFSSQSIARAIRAEERRGRKRKFYGSLPQEHASTAVIERTLEAYQAFVKAKAARLISKYRLPEAERDDLEQIGRLAIMEVIRRGAGELYTKNVEWRMLMYCKREGRVATSWRKNHFLKNEAWN
jgi:hypothetical protein